MPTIASPPARATPWPAHQGSSKNVVGFDDRGGAGACSATWRPLNPSGTSSALLYHHRRVGGRGDTPAVNSDRQLARPSYLGNEFIGRLAILLPSTNNSSSIDVNRRISPPMARMCVVALEKRPAFDRLYALSLMRPTPHRDWSPYRKAPKFHRSIWWAVSGRQHLGPVDVVDANVRRICALDKVADAHFAITGW